jgi:tetratricopeptide (TPR) repeat protein
LSEWPNYEGISDGLSVKQRIDLHKQRREIMLILKENPEDLDKWFQLAYIEFLLTNFGKMKKILTKVLRVNPKHPQSLILLAINMYSLGDKKEAAGLYIKGLEHTTGELDIEGVASFASELFDSKMYDEAEHLFRMLVEKQPDNPLFWHSHGVVMDMMGRGSEGEKALRKAIKLEPDDIMHHVVLGIILERMERYEEAEASYRRAHSIEPHNPYPKKHLERLFQMLGREEEAALVWYQDLGEWAKSLSEEERERLMEYEKIVDESFDEFLLTHYPPKDDEVI